MNFLADMVLFMSNFDDFDNDQIPGKCAQIWYLVFAFLCRDFFALGSQNDEINVKWNLSVIPGYKMFLFSYLTVQMSRCQGGSSKHSLPLYYFFPWVRLCLCVDFSRTCLSLSVSFYVSLSMCDCLFAAAKNVWSVWENKSLR